MGRPVSDDSYARNSSIVPMPSSDDFNPSVRNAKGPVSIYKIDMEGSRFKLKFIAILLVSDDYAIKTYTLHRLFIYNDRSNPILDRASGK